MALQTLNTIKQWFRTGLKPTQTQFWDTWDSFRHKYEKVPVKEVEGIDELLLSKADKTALDNHLDDKNAHAPQINTDWNSASGFSQLINKPEFKTINGEPIIGSGDIVIETSIHEGTPGYFTAYDDTATNIKSSIVKQETGYIEIQPLTTNSSGLRFKNLKNEISNETQYIMNTGAYNDAGCVSVIYDAVYDVEYLCDYERNITKLGSDGVPQAKYHVGSFIFKFPAFPNRIYIGLETEPRSTVISYFEIGPNDKIITKVATIDNLYLNRNFSVYNDNTILFTASGEESIIKLESDGTITKTSAFPFFEVRNVSCNNIGTIFAFNYSNQSIYQLKKDSTNWQLYFYVGNNNINDLISDSENNMYLTVYGELYKINTSGDSASIIYNQNTPLGRIKIVNNSMYVMSTSKGDSGLIQFINDAVIRKLSAKDGLETYVFDISNDEKFFVMPNPVSPTTRRIEPKLGEVLTVDERGDVIKSDKFPNKQTVMDLMTVAGTPNLRRVLEAGSEGYVNTNIIIEKQGVGGISVYNSGVVINSQSTGNFNIEAGSSGGFQISPSGHNWNNYGNSVININSPGSGISLNGAGGSRMSLDLNGVNITSGIAEIILAGGGTTGKTIIRNGGLKVDGNTDVTNILYCNIFNTYRGNGREDMIFQSDGQYNVTAQNGIFLTSLNDMQISISSGKSITINGQNIVRRVNGIEADIDGNVVLSDNTKQVKDSQITISGNTTIQDSWNGQTILFTGNGTITVPATLPEEFSFNAITMPTVSIDWAIMSPFVWMFGAPSITPEKTYFNFTRVGATNNIILSA